MSIQSLAFTSATTATFGPVSASQDPRRLSLMASIFEALTVSPAKVVKHCNKVDQRKGQLKVKRIAEEKGIANLNATKVDEQISQMNIQPIDASNTIALKKKHANSNWIELRARVESVDSRVFAYQNDPKYRLQSDKSKQRRALAAATSKSPGWH